MTPKQINTIRVAAMKLARTSGYEFVAAELDKVADELAAPATPSDKQEAVADCTVCGGTGDVSGEYPGEACQACGGSGNAAPLAQSAEQDRIDAERWRYAVKHWLDEHIATKQADEAIAKGASK